MEIPAVNVANSYGDLLPALGGSFEQLFQPSVLLLLLLGVLIGGIVGFLPGVGALVTLTLMLPFTFTMSPFESFALLLGAYAVIATTGDLTSILIGVPSHPDSAALIMDGYPLAQQGQATRAMGAAVASGTIGALIGAAALALSVPIVRPLVLELGSPETFMLAMLGVAVVGSVSGRSILKGVIGGGLGLILAAVGTNAQTGVPRFTLDSLYLIDGIPLVPIAVGMFAIPELVDMHRRRTSIALERRTDNSSAWQGVLDTFRYRGAMVRGSLIGVGIGTVPGVGGAVSQWMSYGSAVAASKTPEKFGKGAMEGVIAPGACNNSKEGGQLIPTVAFGLPGSAAMAILLGAFLIQGLNPGPEMLTTHLDVTFFMVLVLVVANVVGSALCFPLLKYIALITFVRGELLVPFILVLVLVGAASSNGVMEDVLLALAVGVIAWLMKWYGWPIVPVLLGLVLGQTAETNLSISINVHGATWLYRPVVLVLMAVIVLAVALAYRSRRRGMPMDGIEDEGEDSRSRPGTLIGSAFVVLITLAVLAEASSFTFAARIYPQIIAVVTLVCALLLIGRTLWVRNREEASDDAESHGTAGSPASYVDAGLAYLSGTDVLTPAGSAQAVSHLVETQEAPLAHDVSTKRTLSGFAWCFAAAMVIWVVGFVPCVFVLTGLYLRFVAKLSWLKALIIAVTFAVTFDAVFVEFLRLQLPPTLLDVPLL
jgi:putative tricarboxylic transport membrane protein